MIPTDRRLLLRVATFQTLPKTSVAKCRTRTITTRSFYRTMQRPKALIPRQIQQLRRAKVGFVARAVADVVEGLGQKVAVSERQ